VPKKVRKAALRSALSQRWVDASVKVLDKLEMDAISTKAFAGVMKTLGLSKPLLVVQGKNEMLERSCRNIPYTKVLRVEGLNVYDVVRHEQLVVTVEALARIEEALLS
jgi:large subunit ribosomal protein L4